MRRHLLLAALHHAAHAHEVAVAGHQRPELRKRIFPSRMSAFDRAAEIRLEDAHRLGYDAAHLGIDRGVTPVLAVGDAQSLDPLRRRFEIVDVAGGN